MLALQLLQFKYDHSSHDDANEFLETFDVQTAHLPAETKLALLQQSCIGEWPNSVLSMEGQNSPKNLSPAVAWQLETSLKNIIRETARSSAPLVSVRIFYHEAASHGIDWLLRLSFQDQFTPIIKARRSCRKQFATVYIQFATVYIQDESRRPKTFRA